MADKKRPKINWTAVSAISALVVAVATVGAYFWGPSIPVINSLADPPALTATIKSFRYRHAETNISARREEWREQWLQPFEDKLKERGIAPEPLETLVAAMEELINEKIEWEFDKSPLFDIANSQKWYSVTIRNDGDKPLISVFLKFPAADYWIDERGRLVFAPLRIEIGDMDQKSEESFTFWGGRRGWTFPNDKVVLESFRMRMNRGGFPFWWECDSR